MAKLIFSCLCLLDAIVELHAMVGKKMLNDYLIRKVYMDFTCKQGIFNSSFTVFICSGRIYHIKLKILVYIYESIF